jgi:pseudouridine-5'-monophosphatase
MTARTSSDTQFITPGVLGVALDMDGLLFETESLYWTVGQRVLDRRGHKFSHPLQQRMMGRVGVAAIQQMIDFHQLDDDPHDLLAECDAIYHELLAEGPDPMPGLDHLIDALISSGIPFGIATSSRKVFANRILEPQRWFDSLAFLLTGDDVQNGKPHPEMYLTAADRLGICPTRMLVLEDSGNGSAAGVAAGAVVIAVPSQFTRDHSFENVHAVAQSLCDPIIGQTLGVRDFGV